MKNLEIPPHNLDAERSVLGSILCRDTVLDDVCEVIDKSDFYVTANAIVFETCVRIRAKGGRIDAVTLAQQCEADGTLAEIGGAHEIVEILETVPHSERAVHYANLVLHESRRRQVMRIGRDLYDSAIDPTADSARLMENGIAAIMRLTDQISRTDRGSQTLHEHVDRVVEELAVGRKPTMFWGIDEIDRALGGVALGELVLIGARPSHGKTMVGMQWLQCASAKGIPGLMVSEEMSPATLAARSLSSITTLTDEEWSRDIDRLKFDVADWFRDKAPILIADKCRKIGSVERAIGRAVQRVGVQIVCVDYAQLIDGDGENAAAQIGDVSRKLKAAAVRHNIIVLLLAQLNRSIESRENPKPQLSDLRGSGELEQDADIALFPIWPWKMDETFVPAHEYRIYVRKNRNRGIGTPIIQMRINAARQRLESNYIDTPADNW